VEGSHLTAAKMKRCHRRKFGYVLGNARWTCNVALVHSQLPGYLCTCASATDTGHRCLTRLLNIGPRMCPAKGPTSTPTASRSSRAIVASVDGGVRPLDAGAPSHQSSWAFASTAWCVTTPPLSVATRPAASFAGIPAIRPGRAREVICCHASPRPQRPGPTGVPLGRVTTAHPCVSACHRNVGPCQARHCLHRCLRRLLACGIRPPRHRRRSNSTTTTCCHYHHLWMTQIATHRRRSSPTTVAAGITTSG
jgi:hypothetical protein